MTAQLVTGALIMAIWRRGKHDSLLHHSDQGIAIYERAVPATDGRPRHHLFNEPVGLRLDNAAMESFFSSLKDRADSPQGLQDER